MLGLSNRTYGFEAFRSVDILDTDKFLLRYLWCGGRFRAKFVREELMKILAAIKQEEKRLKKQLGNVQDQLESLRKAASALGRSANKEFARVEKRVVSAAAKAKMSRAAKKRWAKVKAQAKKVVS